MRNGSMHGAELGSFVCAAGKERVVHLVSMHALILASGSLLTTDEDERDKRAMQTINFQKSEDLPGKRVFRRCRDCTLAFWQTCTLPRRSGSEEPLTDMVESVLG